MINKNWSKYQIPIPTLKNYNRLTGSDFKRLLKALGINDGEDYRLGWLAKYPSVVCSIAILDPHLLFDGVAPLKDPSFYKVLRDCFSIARKIDDQSGASIVKVKSSNCLGYFEFDTYPTTAKSFDNRTIIKILSDPNKVIKDIESAKRMLKLKQKRLTVRSHVARKIEHDPLIFFRDMNQGRFICLEENNRSIHTQINILLDHGYRVKGPIEIRQCDTATGSRIIQTIGSFFSDDKGKLKYIISNLPKDIDLYCLTLLFSRLGMKDYTLNKECTLRNIDPNSILYTKELWVDHLKFNSLAVTLEPERKFIRIKPIVIPDKTISKKDPNPDPITGKVWKPTITRYETIQTITSWDDFKKVNSNPTITIVNT